MLMTLTLGDVIHVDAGLYELARTIKIGADDAGVRIEGPATGQALLRRWVRSVERT